MPTTRTVTQTLYTIQELSGPARERALDWLARCIDVYDWWEFTVDDFVRLLALVGVRTTAKDVQFSGFSSQGDGASFTGSYAHETAGAAALKKEAPGESELHAIVQRLTEIQKRHSYQLTATISRRTARYAHEHTVNIEVDTPGEQDLVGSREVVAECLRDFMCWLYRRLEAEYGYQMSEEQCLESADANGYTFDGTGKVI